MSNRSRISRRTALKLVGAAGATVAAWTGQILPEIAFAAVMSRDVV